jgi:hypothetical protein
MNLKKIAALLTLTTFTFTNSALAAPMTVHDIKIPENIGRVKERWGGGRETIDNRPETIDPSSPKGSAVASPGTENRERRTERRSDEVTSDEGRGDGELITAHRSLITDSDHRSLITDHQSLTTTPVILIQDAHSSFEAQENIARILDVLTRSTTNKNTKSDTNKETRIDANKEGRRDPSSPEGFAVASRRDEVTSDERRGDGELITDHRSLITDHLTHDPCPMPLNVFLEGARGEVRLDDLRAFPDAAIRKKVISEFLQKGEINGATYFAITSEAELEVYGLEDQELYKKNYAAYRAVKKYEKKINEILAEIEKNLNHDVKTFFSKEQKTLLNSFQEYKSGKKDFLAYVVETEGRKRRTEGRSDPSSPEGFAVASRRDEETKGRGDGEPITDYLSPITYNLLPRFTYNPSPTHSFLYLEQFKEALALLTTVNEKRVEKEAREVAELVGTENRRQRREDREERTEYSVHSAEKNEQDPDSVQRTMHAALEAPITDHRSLITAHRSQLSAEGIDFTSESNYVTLKNIALARRIDVKPFINFFTYAAYLEKTRSLDFEELLKEVDQYTYYLLSELSVNHDQIELTHQLRDFAILKKVLALEATRDEVALFETLINTNKNTKSDTNFNTPHSFDAPLSRGEFDLEVSPIKGSTAHAGRGVVTENGDPSSPEGFAVASRRYEVTSDEGRRDGELITDHRSLITDHSSQLPTPNSQLTTQSSQLTPLTEILASVREFYVYAEERDRVMVERFLGTQRTEDREQRTENRGQRTEDREERTEYSVHSAEKNEQDPDSVQRTMHATLEAPITDHRLLDSMTHDSLSAISYKLSPIITTPSSQLPAPSSQLSAPLNVLITGGYHTEGIKNELRKMNIPYVVITPAIADLSKSLPYHDLMLGKYASTIPFFSTLEVANILNRLFDEVMGSRGITEAQFRELIYTKLADEALQISGLDGERILTQFFKELEGSNSLSSEFLAIQKIGESEKREKALFTFITELFKKNDFKEALNKKLLLSSVLLAPLFASCASFTKPFHYWSEPEAKKAPKLSEREGFRIVTKPSRENPMVPYKELRIARDREIRRNELRKSPYLWDKLKSLFVEKRGRRERGNEINVASLLLPMGVIGLGARGQRTENRERRTENGKQRTEDREERTEYSVHSAEKNEQDPDSVQRTMHAALEAPITDHRSLDSMTLDPLSAISYKLSPIITTPNSQLPAPPISRRNVLKLLALSAGATFFGVQFGFRDGQIIFNQARGGIDFEFVGNFQTTSFRKYAIDFINDVVLPYTDREHSLIGDLPFEINGGLILQTPNDDRHQIVNELASFKAEEDLVFYVAYKDEGAELPNFLAGYTDCESSVTLKYSWGGTCILKLFKKYFQAGEIINLGGNKGAEVNYFGFVKKSPIGNFQTTSFRKYAIDFINDVVLPYTDREHSLIGDLPFEINGGLILQTPNDDRHQIVNELASFKAEEDLVFYVAYKDEGAELPNFLAGYTDCESSVTLKYSWGGTCILKLFKKYFQAGEIINLGGNKGAEVNYFGFVILASSPPLVEQFNFIATTSNAEYEYTTGVYADPNDNGKLKIVMIDTKYNEIVAMHDVPVDPLTGAQYYPSALSGLTEVRVEWRYEGAIDLRGFRFWINEGRTDSAGKTLYETIKSPSETKNIEALNTWGNGTYARLYPEQFINFNPYTDSTHSVANLPHQLANSEVIQTPMADASNASDTVASFFTKDEVDVFIVTPPRADNAQPAFLSREGYTRAYYMTYPDTGEPTPTTSPLMVQMRNPDGMYQTFEVYKKRYPKGAMVRLGGNSEASGAFTGWAANYFVLVRPPHWKGSMYHSSPGFRRYTCTAYDATSDSPFSNEVTLNVPEIVYMANNFLGFRVSDAKLLVFGFNPETYQFFLHDLQDEFDTAYPFAGSYASLPARDLTSFKEDERQIAHFSKEVVLERSLALPRAEKFDTAYQEELKATLPFINEALNRLDSLATQNSALFNRVEQALTIVSGGDLFALNGYEEGIYLFTRLMSDARNDLSDRDLTLYRIIFALAHEADEERYTDHTEIIPRDIERLSFFASLGVDIKKMVALDGFEYYQKLVANILEMSVRFDIFGDALQYETIHKFNTEPIDGEDFDSYVIVKDTYILESRTNMAADIAYHLKNGFRNRNHLIVSLNPDEGESFDERKSEVERFLIEEGVPLLARVHIEYEMEAPQAIIARLAVKDFARVSVLVDESLRRSHVPDKVNIVQYNPVVPDLITIAFNLAKNKGVLDAALSGSVIQNSLGVYSVADALIKRMQEAILARQIEISA